MTSRLFAGLALLAAMCGCGTPSAPSEDSGDATRITGSERLAWDQSATEDASQLSYVVYVDGSRLPLTGVSCVRSGSAYMCQASMPSLTSGLHTLAVAAWTSVNGNVLESDRSPQLSVFRAAAVTAFSGLPITAGDVTVERIASGLHAVSGLAPSDDGRIFVAETDRIVVVQDGRVLEAPALTLGDHCESSDSCVLDLALHQDFKRNHLVFTAQTSGDAGGANIVRVTRYRELHGELGEPTVIRQFSVGPETGRARIRFGPDGMLYVSIAGRPEGELAAAYEGSVMRLTPDGATPRDNPGGSPIVSSGHGNVRAFEWMPNARDLWAVETHRRGGTLERLAVTVARLNSPGESRWAAAANDTRIDLPPPVNPLALATFREFPSLSAAGELESEAGDVFEVSVGRDGWVYFSTRRADKDRADVTVDTIWRVYGIR